MESKIFKIDDENAQQRVDKFLAQKLSSYSREFIKVLCKKQYVKINGKPVDPDVKLRSGDIVEVYIPERHDYVVIGKFKDINVIYEDTDLLVINKPPCLKVHPARKFDTDVTLLDWLYQAYPQNVKEDWFLNRPFLVHRLDKDTSGVMVIAKTSQAQCSLARQFQQRQVKKVYRAIVSGRVNIDEGEIIAPVRVQKNIAKIHCSGKNAQTKFKVLSTKDGFSYLELYPITGRTHQIRTHLSFIGHPVIGDTKYNGFAEVKGKLVPRYMLHAYKIEFLHPRREKWVSFTAKLPEDFKFFLSYLSLEI